MSATQTHLCFLSYHLLHLSFIFSAAEEQDINFIPLSISSAIVLKLLFSFAMKLLAATLSYLLVLSTDAFSPIGVNKARCSPSTSTTSLNNYGLGSYNAQKKPMISGANAAAAADSYKSSPRWRKKTKQLATLGPASSSFEMIEKLFLAGADVFRLNFSHGEHAQKQELLDIIRQVESKYDHPIAILGDLQGPKLRVGTFENPDGELLMAGQIFRFDLDPTPGSAQRVMLPHPEIIEASEVGHELLIDDGKMKLEVVGTGPGYLDCTVVVPGKIKDRKVRVMNVQLLCLLSSIHFHFIPAHTHFLTPSFSTFEQCTYVGCQHTRLHPTNQLSNTQGQNRFGVYATDWCGLDCIEFRTEARGYCGD